MAGNNFVFGAYTHCSWPAVIRTVADPTGKSFLFSLVNVTSETLIFPLRDKARAVSLAVRGVCFGADKFKDGKTAGYPNFILMLNGAADEKDANGANDPVEHGTPYQADDAYLPEDHDGQMCDATFFAGEALFAAAEIEVFQL